MPYPSIAKQNGYDANSQIVYPVLIVGAGESGIALGCRLKQVLGFDQFRIFERQAGLGGTWWINRYPGVACDVPAVFYSFSFAPNHKWTTICPPGNEIVKYLEGVCEKYQIVDKIQFNTEVAGATWLEDEGLWQVTLIHLRRGTGDLSRQAREALVRDHGDDQVYIRKEVVKAKILASAVGGLVEPNTWPEGIAGKDDFKGDIFHSARWNYDVDINDKDVVVVGTGCSAAQLVPCLTKAPYNAKSVTQLMRSPPWVCPPPIPLAAKKSYEEWSSSLFTTIPGLGWLMRMAVAARGEYDWRLFGEKEYNKNERKKVERELLAHMKKMVPTKYHEILTPDYGVCCKRRIFDQNWLQSLHDPKIELTTRRLVGLTPHGVKLGPDRSASNKKGDTDAGEIQRHADVIVLASGFDTSQWLHSLSIRGKGGKLLTDVWAERGGPQAYQGTAIDGFPNMFLIIGPNTVTGHSSVILATENMVNYSLKLMKPILQGDVSLAEVKREAEISYTRNIQEKLKDTVWMREACQSWYKDKNGWNSTVYPYSQIHFGLRCMFPRWRDWSFTYTRQGQIKRRIRRVSTILVLVATVAGLRRARAAGLDMRGVYNLLLSYVRKSVDIGIEALSWR